MIVTKLPAKAGSLFLYLIIFISKKEYMILNIISIVLDLIIVAMLLESIKKGG